MLKVVTILILIVMINYSLNYYRKYSITTISSDYYNYSFKYKTSENSVDIEFNQARDTCNIIDSTEAEKYFSTVSPDFTKKSLGYSYNVLNFRYTTENDLNYFITERCIPKLGLTGGKVYYISYRHFYKKQ